MFANFLHFEPPSLSGPNDHGKNFIGLLKIFGLSLELLGKQVGRWLGSPLEDHPRKVVIGSPPKVRPFGRDPTTRFLGDLQSPWLLTTYKSWDDPPSSSQ